MKKVTLLLLIIPFLGLCQVQIGQTINGEAAFDSSGRGLSLSSDGSILAIGADYNGEYSGHVRIYENQSGTWVQIGQDIDGEAENDNGSGLSLSSDGSIVAIGAIGNDGNGDNSGHVRIYENISGVWTQIDQDIDGETAGDFSGDSISLSSNGSIVAIGAPNNNGNGSDSGHVRIFENISGVWTQIGQDIDGENAFDESGDAVSLSSDGSIVAISAERNNGNGINSGHVRIFENISGVWTQIGQDIDGENAQDGFGWSVSLSSDGSVVAIGAVKNSDNGSNSGHVRVYKNQSGNWIQIGDDIDGENPEDLFGYKVSLSSDGSIVAVSSIWEDENGENSGSVRVFDLTSLLALEESSIFEFSIYPNPAKDQFSIQLNDLSTLEKVTVYNTLGQEVLTSEKTMIDTSKLLSGSYIVEIITNTGKSSKTLIIE